MKREPPEPTQTLYDGFNQFILSDDTKVFGKMLARTLLFDQVKHITGDIVECGVFKGTGMLTFLKLKRFLCPNTVKKVIGFDYFDTDELLSNLNFNDKAAMDALFTERNFTHAVGYADILAKNIKSYGFKTHEFELVSGDISIQAPLFVQERPGFRISLLYIDLDIEQPTFDTLTAMWDRVSLGGVVAFDEYAYHNWSEANGVDRFFQDKGVRVKSLDYMAPTAMVEKCF